MNKVVLIGRLTKDLELKKTPSGISYVNFTIAVNRTYADESGERQADFINCIAWRAQAENLSKYMGKGSLIAVDGSIQTRTYEAETGTRYITEVLVNSVQFLESKNSGSTTNASAKQPESIEDTTLVDEDLPF